MPQQDPIELEHSEVSPQEAQAELEAVLHSPVFERSERPQRFLRFICELTLRGDGARINEYLIGSEVFQRGPEYSPNEDSIVRRQALTLRQKLQEYYTTEGRDHHVRIELPVGRYVPVFRRTESALAPVAVPAPTPAVTPAPTPAPQPVVVPQPKWWEQRWVVPAGGALLFVLGLLIGGVALRGTAADGPAPIGAATREIWGPWLHPGSNAVICFSTPMTAVIKQFEKPLSPDILPKRFKATPEEETLFRSVFKLPEGGHFYYTPVVNQTKVGEAVAGVQLASLLTKAGTVVRTAQSRFVSWEELRNDNYILLGHNEANHSLELILKDYPFRLAVTSDGHPRGIVNVKPAGNERPEYRISYSQAETELDQEYALVSVIPGIASNRRMILINGLNAQATQAGAEYLTNESSLAELLARLKAAAPGHHGPWNFQAILKTEVFDKVPTRPSLITVRVL